MALNDVLSKFLEQYIETGRMKNDEVKANIKHTIEFEPKSESDEKYLEMINSISDKIVADVDNGYNKIGVNNHKTFIFSGANFDDNFYNHILTTCNYKQLTVVLEKMIEEMFRVNKDHKKVFEEIQDAIKHFDPNA
jgi:hypothetical protein